jgi:hypothetical protein
LQQIIRFYNQNKIQVKLRFSQEANGRCLSSYYFLCSTLDLILHPPVAFSVPLWRRCPAYQLLVGAHTLKLGTAPRTVEPFFCTLAIWDTRHTRARVTEDFHFDLNRPGDALALPAYEARWFRRRAIMANNNSEYFSRHAFSPHTQNFFGSTSVDFCQVSRAM